MGHLFEDECWAIHPRGCSFGCLWLRKLAKAMAKALKGNNAFLAHLFMKIIEIVRKGGERSHVTCEEENEENRGLIHKKAPEE